MANIKFKRPATLPKWCVVILPGYGAVSERDVQQGLAHLKAEFANCGLRNANQMVPVISVPQGPRNLPEWTAALTTGFAGKLKEGVELILYIMPSKDKTSDLYAAVKQAADIHVGIHTVGVVGSRFIKPGKDGRPDRQYYANVALKFNLKLGGANQTLLDSDLSNNVKHGSLMLVGLDVTVSMAILIARSSLIIHPAPLAEL